MSGTLPLLTHTYLSTACLHGHHDLCGRLQHDRGEPGAPHCKYCPAPCSCTDPACWHARGQERAERADEAALAHVHRSAAHIRRPGSVP